MQEILFDRSVQLRNEMPIFAFGY